MREVWLVVNSQLTAKEATVVVPEDVGEAMEVTEEGEGISEI